MKNLLLRPFTHMGLSLMLLLLLAQPGLSETLNDWHEDSAGLKTALENHKNNNKPVFLYIYAPWCCYCKKLDKQLLETPAVQAYLSNYEKVKVYPSNGQNEKQIATALGVRGYPTVFVKSANSTKYVRIDAYKPVNGEWVMMQPNEYIQTLETIEAAKTQK